MPMRICNERLMTPNDALLGRARHVQDIDMTIADGKLSGSAASSKAPLLSGPSRDSAHLIPNVVLVIWL
jgi:hypothetical protein